MAYPVDNSFVLDGKSINTSYTTTLDSFVASGLLAPFLTLGIITATGLVMLFNRLCERGLIDKQGNKIPNGPSGFHIAGQSESLLSPSFNMIDN